MGQSLKEKDVNFTEIRISPFSEAEFDRLCSQLEAGGKIILDFEDYKIDFCDAHNLNIWLKLKKFSKSGEHRLIYENCPIQLVHFFNQNPEALCESIEIESFYIPIISRELTEKRKYKITSGVDFHRLEVMPDFESWSVEIEGQSYGFDGNVTTYFQFLPESDLNRYVVFDNTFDGVVIVGQHREIICLNESAAAMLGVSTKRVRKKRPYCYDVINFANQDLYCMPGGSEGRDEVKLYEEMAYKNSKGGSGHIQIQIVRDPASGTSRPRWIIHLHSVSLERELASKYNDQRQKKEELSVLALHDEMTGLNNYRSFSNSFKSEVQRSFRYGYELGLVICDIDFFKKFNDTYGHQQGDEVLRAVASTLKKCIRTSDFVARYGGEEFVIFLPQTDLEGIRVVMEKVRQGVENCLVEDINNPENNLSVTLSLGGISIDKSDTNLGSDCDIKPFVESADRNLYQAKESGRNCCIVSKYKKGL